MENRTVTQTHTHPCPSSYTIKPINFSRRAARWIRARSRKVHVARKRGTSFAVDYCMFMIMAVLSCAYPPVNNAADPCKAKYGRHSDEEQQNRDVCVCVCTRSMCSIINNNKIIGIVTAFYHSRSTVYRKRRLHFKIRYFSTRGTYSTRKASINISFVY